MAHITFLDALVLTLQVLWKITLNFWPVVLMFIAFCVHEVLTDKPSAK